VRTLACALLTTLGAVACGSAEPEPMPSAGPRTTTVGETTTETAAPPPPSPPRRKAKAPPGVPLFVAGYRDWVKLNRRPIPPRASDPHNGTKNVFAARRPADGVFPNGSIVVKEAVRPGADFVGLIAIMRKRAGADPEHHDWILVEYTRESAGARFRETASGTVCWSCHVGAETGDYVFTLRR
jgi:hypothetical protein